MRSLRLAVLPLLVATSLAAQAPVPSADSSAPAATVAPQRTVFFDFAALANYRERFGLEPLVLGRWAIGLIGTHSSMLPPIKVEYLNGPLMGPSAAQTVLCPIGGCQFDPASVTSYNAWSLDAAVRYYPATLSFGDARWGRITVYLGAFTGYQWRAITQVSAAGPLVSEDRTVITGVEPGTELGLRFKPLAPIFVDVGGWFKLVRLDDPGQSLRPGQLDARLVTAVGIGW